ncbi:MAG TPA: TRAP transporter small permease [Azospirillum sp.]|nr:TRAP transporter small permease [Azospirillum sp.]
MLPQTSKAARHGVPERAVRILDTVNAAAGKAAFAALWVLSGVVLLDVALRTFGTPTLWGSEVSVYLMLAVAFLGVGHATTEDAHFRVTVITGMLSPRVQRMLDLLCDLLALVFTIGFTVGAARLLLFYHQLGFQTNTILRVPLALLQALVVVGGVFLAMALVANILRFALGLEHPKPPPDLPPA